MNSDVKFGLIILSLGVLMLVLALSNPGWFFQENGRVYGLGSMVRYFGRTAARFFVGGFGVLLILGAAFFFWVASS